MYEIENYYIEDKYLVRDKSSSDGSQIKYFVDGKWYKVDYYGGEGEAEYLASELLSCTNIDISKYVKYDRLIINDMPGCVSDDFRNDEEEEFVTLYRLYKNVYGRDLATVTSKMDYDDAIMYVIDFVKKQTGLDITTYLANTFWLDSIILNTDRHFNNYGIIMSPDGYREAPIFDNGKSLLTGHSIKSNSDIDKVIKGAYSKSFSPNFRLNYNYLKEYCTVTVNKEKMVNMINTLEDTLQMKVFKYQLSTVSDIL